MRNQHKHAGHHGFTLIELIIYTAVFSVVSAVFVGALLQLNLGSAKSAMTSEVQHNVRLATETIAQTLRSATNVVAPIAGSSGNSLDAVVNGQTIQYSLAGTVLQKQTGAAPAESITTDAVKVTYLNFTTLQNTASSNNTVQATTTQFALTIAYNSAEPQFAYSQSATSTEKVGNR